MKFEKEIRKYCETRISQLKEYEPALDFFNSKHQLNGYYRGLTNILRELDGKNEDSLKEENIHWILRSNGECGLFSQDFYSLLSTGKTVLPTELLEIPAFLDEQERVRKAEEQRVLEEQHRQQQAEFERLFEQRVKTWQAKEAAKMGISPETLARLQSEGKKNEQQ